MKQTSKYAIVFLAGAIFATAGSAYGAEAIKTISAKLRPDIKVSVNGKQLDASAISYNNTTYLPLRKAAEAVGGKIELNGSSINIVTTNGNNSTGSTEKIPTSEQIHPIEGKTLYFWDDVFYNLIALNRPQISGSVINGKSVVTFEGQSYIRIRNIDYFYDSDNDKNYLSREFLLQFLNSSDLNGLSSYRVENNTVIPILQ